MGFMAQENKSIATYVWPNKFYPLPSITFRSEVRADVMVFIMYLLSENQKMISFVHAFSQQKQAYLIYTTKVKPRTAKSMKCTSRKKTPVLNITLYILYTYNVL